MESRTDRMAKILVITDMESPEIAFLITDIAEDAVVWSNKRMVAGLDKNRPSSRTNTRINNRHMYGTRWKRWITGEQGKGRGLDVLRRYVVCDVHNSRFRIDGKDHAFHRTDKIIRCAEVRQKG